jgi:large subunit ribosomal protein L19
MLASQNRLLSGSRTASFKQQQPFVAAGRSRVQPTIVAKAKLAPLVDAFKADQLRTDLPPVAIGDTVRLGLLVQEGKGKTRTQRLEGVVIAQSGSGSNTTITVRRVFQGVGVEMNFFLNSPVLGGLEVLRRAKVRRAKLYYLRDRTGKSARLKELFVRKDKAAAAAN